jgi:predicted enzyme related to lactoylglutathione lyase
MSVLPTVDPVERRYRHLEAEWCRRLITPVERCIMDGSCPPVTSGCVGPLVETSWVAIGCSPYFGALYRQQRARGKKLTPPLPLLRGGRAASSTPCSAKNEPFEKRLEKAQNKNVLGCSGHRLTAVLLREILKRASWVRMENRGSDYLPCGTLKVRREKFDLASLILTNCRPMPSLTAIFRGVCESCSLTCGFDLSCNVMITSIHTLIYSDDANATRAFLRDVLGWKYVAEDWDNDWLIFKSGPSEMGVHPTHSVWEGKTYDHPRHHSIALMCDDIDATVDELRAKGAQFRGPIEQLEYGRVIMMIVPGADDIQLYQPTHKLAYNL